MRCVLTTDLNKRQAQKQAAAIAFLVCFVVVSLFSEAFILTHIGHVHDQNGIGDGCTICAQIVNTENIIKQLGTAVIVGLFTSAGLYAAAIIFRAVCSNTSGLTPVTSKIRMNN